MLNAYECITWFIATNREEEKRNEFGTGVKRNHHRKSYRKKKKVDSKWKCPTAFAMPLKNNLFIFSFLRFPMNEIFETYVVALFPCLSFFGIEFGSFPLALNLWIFRHVAVWEKKNISDQREIWIIFYPNTEPRLRPSHMNIYFRAEIRFLQADTFFLCACNFAHSILNMFRVEIHGKMFPMKTFVVN